MFLYRKKALALGDIVPQFPCRSFALDPTAGLPFPDPLTLRPVT